MSVPTGQQLNTQEIKENRLIPLSLVFPHERNYKEHPQAQIKKLVASLERWGQVRSIVVQECANGSYTIVAGHGVTQAAQKLKYQELRADILPQSWSPVQISGYLVADNELGNDAVDNDVLLAELLQEQKDLGFDLASLGKDDESLRQMLEALGDERLTSGEEEGRTRTTELAEPGGGEVQANYGVLITCQDEQEQEKAYELAQREGFTCKVLTL